MTTDVTTKPMNFLNEKCPANDQGRRVLSITDSLVLITCGGGGVEHHAHGTNG